MISREPPTALELKATEPNLYLLRDATAIKRVEWAHRPAIVAEMATMAVSYRLSGKGE